MENTYLINEIPTIFPDAKDQIRYTDLMSYCNSIVLPPKFNANNIINGNKFYVKGNKGVGKTAILFYLKYKISQTDPEAFCSMLLFKTNYKEIERQKMDSFSEKLISFLKIPEEELRNVKDFTQIWKLVIFKKIVDDNQKNNYQIYEKDNNWDQFVDYVKNLSLCKNGAVLGEKDEIPFPVKIPDKYSHDSNGNIIVEGEMDYPAEQCIKLFQFDDAMEFTTKLFFSLKPMHKYYFCIDELELYRDDDKIFLRDLYMIKDLIILVKELNDQLIDYRISNMRFILSIRTEVVNAINSKIASNELNKLMDFAENIEWGSKIQFTVFHPLMLIWINKLIETFKIEDMRPDEVYDSFFPTVIGIQDTVEFIMERTWLKPRNITTFINCMTKISENDASEYSVKMFYNCLASYSEKVYEDISEELNCIFDKQEISYIFRHLYELGNFFKKKNFICRFTKENFNTHMQVNKILATLYRTGIVGYKSIGDIEECWYHLEQKEMPDSLPDDCIFVIHRGLWSVLKLEKISCEGIHKADIIGVPISCFIKKYKDMRFELQFEYKGVSKKGSIHIKDVTGKHINQPEKYVGNTMTFYVVDYESKRKEWIFKGNI